MVVVGPWKVDRACLRIKCLGERGGEVGWLAGVEEANFWMDGGMDGGV